VDSLFFMLSMSLNTYISRIADPEDLRPTLSMAVTMNHVAAVVMPLVGGYLWMAAGYETIFSTGLALSLVAFFVARGLRVLPRGGTAAQAPSG
jgi:predicted MFS family arabinose efflux permease